MSSLLRALIAKIKSIFMKRRVRLFIGGMEVEFKTTPDILYNFKVDDLLSPAAVKNSYSKTVTIPGTKANNRIFDNFFLNDYLTNGTNFDPTKKTEFTIYIDSTPYETGYCRLDGVTQNKHYWEWTVSLFGGLGEFMYNLEYSDNPQGDDEKRKLSDLEFYAGPDSTVPFELGFEISKETVKDAWDNIDGYSSKWSVINFAPAYNGLPSDFDADKVLINTGSVTASGNTGPVVRRPGGRGSVIVTGVTSGGTTYRTYGGYAVASLSREYTDAEMREFRSYLMRPVISAKKVIEAICRPENNGGWEVELDPEFFYYDNCYYQDMWVTLPMLSSLDYTVNIPNSSATVSLGAMATGTRTSGDPGFYEDRLAVLSVPDSGMSFDVNVKMTLDMLGVQNGAQDKLVLCAYYPSGGFTYASAIFVQLVAFDSFGNPVAGSDEYYITSAYGARRVSDGRGRSQVYANFLSPSDWNYNQPYGNGYVSSTSPGYFEKVSGSTWRWDEEISLTAKNVPAGSTLKVVLTKVYKAGGSPSGAKKVFYRQENPGAQTTYTTYNFNGFNLTINSSQVSFKSNEGIRTGAVFTKNQLLDTDYSIADFLLSYAKIFGLYFLKDTPEKKIKILTRKNFFQRDNIVDIQDLVDRSNLKITPLVFNNKWYKWDLAADESEYGKAYVQTYGKPYGQKRINTGYNFNKNTFDVLDGNVFKGAVQVLERSDAFCYTEQDKTSKPWMFPGYSYLLYNATDATDTTEITVQPSSTIDAFSGFTTGYKYYDLFDKCQLHTADNSPSDGTNVLLIRNGNRELSVGSVDLGYWITDDNSYMNLLNDGKPCWLYTNSGTDAQDNVIAVKADYAPYFSRYMIYPASGYIVRSLDFGKPEEIYIPGAYYRQGSTLYEEFWEEYISDLYSKDSRVVKTKMLIRETPTVSWLRRFFYFDGSLWRMTAINDYNVGQEKLTEVEFVRVQDVEKYTNAVISNIPVINITLSQYSIGYSGGTVQYTVTVSDGGSWYIDNYDWDTTISLSAGTGDYTGTWTIPASSSNSELQRTLRAMADNSSAVATLTQQGVRLSVAGPAEQGDVSWTGGTRTFTVISPDENWSAKTDYTSIITDITPSAGTRTDESGVTVTVTVGQNENTSTRQAYIYAQAQGGLVARSGYLRQEAAQAATITATPDYIGNVPYSGTSYSVVIYSSEPWRGYVTYNDRISISPATGNSGTTYVVLTVAPNDGSQRFAQAMFYRDGSPASDPAIVTISQEEFPIDHSKQYLTFNILSGGTLEWVDGYPNWGVPMYVNPYYSLDGGETWSHIITDETGNTGTLNVNAGDQVMLKSDISGATFGDNGRHWFTGESTAVYDVEGNILSLVYGDAFSANTELALAGQFSRFFAGAKVRSAKNLILSSMTVLGYDYMFSGSTIEIAPETLPATTLSANCYLYMFDNCHNLRTAPEIKATTFANGCCEYMFHNCTSLVNGPELKASYAPARACYSMFRGCSNLVSVKCLATSLYENTLSDSPFRYWLDGTAQSGTLTKAPSATFWGSTNAPVPSGWTIVEAT